MYTVELYAIMMALEWIRKEDQISKVLIEVIHYQHYTVSGQVCPIAVRICYMKYWQHIQE